MQTDTEILEERGKQYGDASVMYEAFEDICRVIDTVARVNGTDHHKATIGLLKSEKHFI